MKKVWQRGFDTPAWTPSSCPAGRFLYGTRRLPWRPLTAASTTDRSSSPPLWTHLEWRGCHRCPAPAHNTLELNHSLCLVSKQQQGAKRKLQSCQLYSQNVNGLFHKGQNRSVWIWNGHFRALYRCLCVYLKLITHLQNSTWFAFSSTAQTSCPHPNSYITTAQCCDINYINARHLKKVQINLKT